MKKVHEVAMCSAMRIPLSAAQEAACYQFWSFVSYVQSFEIFYHCRCASVGQNQDYIISVVCNMYVFIVDFRSFFNAKLWKMIPRIRFSTYFWPPEKIDRIMVIFPKKSENYTYGGTVLRSPLLISTLFGKTSFTTFCSFCWITSHLLKKLKYEDCPKTV